IDQLSLPARESSPAAMTRSRNAQRSNGSAGWRVAISPRARPGKANSFAPGPPRPPTTTAQRAQRVPRAPEGGFPVAGPAGPVDRRDAAVIGEIARRDRAVLANLFQHRGDYARRHARLALVMAPPPRLRAVALSPVERKRIGGENAALLREVLEGVAREE